MKIGADQVVKFIDKNGVDHSGQAWYWMGRGREHLREMTAAEAEKRWGSVRKLPDDPVWAMLLQVAIRVDFEAKGLAPPAWTLVAASGDGSETGASAPRPES